MLGGDPLTGLAEREVWNFDVMMMGIQRPLYDLQHMVPLRPS